MFKNAYQSGLLSIFYSCGSHPLALWDMEVKNGHIKRVTDKEVNSVVLEIMSTNVTTTYITCPPNNQCLGITMPFLVMIVKNLKRYFSFEITILDDRNMRRRFRISNFQSTTKIKPFCTTMPIGLSGGWNQIQFNLSDFTRRAYGSQFLETLRVQVHANVRLRRIYFCEHLYSEEELPQDYKLYLPLEKKVKKGKEKKEPEAAVATTASPPIEEVPTPIKKVAPAEQASPKDQTAEPAPRKKSTVEKRKQSLVAAKKSSVEVKKSTTEVAPSSEEGEEKPLEESEQPPDEATEAGPEELAEAADVPLEAETPSVEPPEAEASPKAEAPPETEALPETEAPLEAEVEEPTEASTEPTVHVDAEEG